MPTVAIVSLTYCMINNRVSVGNLHKPEHAGLICLYFSDGPGIIRWWALGQVEFKQSTECTVLFCARSVEVFSSNRV